MSKSWKKETFVGVFLIIGIAMIVGAVLSIGDFKDGNDKTYPISILYKDAAGLIKGAPLRLGGAVIGEITSAPELTQSGDKVMLLARIKNDVRIQQGSQFRIDMQNLLGDKYIDVVPPTKPTEEYIHAGELIQGESESDLKKIRNNATLASDEIVSLLRKLDKNSEYIEQAIKDISVAAKGLSETTEKLNNGVLSATNIAHLNNIMGNVDTASAQTPELISEAHKTIAELKETSAGARKLLVVAEEKLNQLDPVFNEAAPTIKSLRQTSDNLSTVIKDVKKGNGTIGLLMYDKKFRNSFEDFINNLRDYGILRYRDPKNPIPPADPRAGYSGSMR
ncbi:MAG: MlaD family protein [Akkermansia sp.]